MKKNLCFLALLIWGSVCFSQNIHTYEGKIIDSENGEALPFVKIQLTPSNIGTLSNSDGAFILKVPEYAWTDDLVIQHLGYDVLKVALDNYPHSKKLEVQLTPRTYDLEAVVITPQDPRDLIEQALKNFPKNHPFYTRKMAAFYRETSSINDTILDIAEAVLDAYVYADKPGGLYKSKVKPMKIRKLTNRGPNDTLMDMELMGSNLNPALQKRPNDTGIGGELELKSFLNPETFKFYTYEIKGIAEFYGRQVYIIHFDQDKRFGSKLYKGEIYLDMRTLAFARVKFAFSDKGKRFRFTQLQEGFKMGLMKGLLRMGGIQVDIRQHSAQIDYEYHPDDGLWHKHFVSEKFHVWIKLPSWIFNLMLKQSDEFSKKERKEMVSQISNTYSIQGGSELLITGIEKADAVPSGEGWTKDYNPLKEDLVDNDDPFWQNYNYIKPSTSLQNMEARIKASVKR